MEHQSFQISEIHPNTPPQFHFHEGCELLLCNSAQIQIPDQSFLVQDPSLFFFGSNTLHCVQGTGLFLHISPESLQALSTPQSNFQRLSALSFSSATPTDQSDPLFQQLYALENDGSFGADLLQTSALLQLLVHLCPLFPLSTEEETPTTNPRIRPILDFIHENLAEPLSLPQIAAQFYLSKHHLCHLFKSATGFSVMDYIIQRRVETAKTLLRQGHSVQRAGELAGFSDNSHFIRTFGKAIGTSPGKYRKNYSNLSTNINKILD